MLRDPDPINRGSAATALGRIGADEAMEGLIDALRDPAPNVRGSAATALGKIRAEAAVGPLIDALDDVDPLVRETTVSALGRISMGRTIPDLARNFGKVVEATSPAPEELRNARLESFLRSCLWSGDLPTLEALLAAIDQKLPSSNLFFLPYRVASEFLGRGRDPAVLERQHPEMREAALLVIEEFDRSPKRSSLIPVGA
jgi:HEAT repeat protein